jgi:hypothetical protein
LPGKVHAFGEFQRAERRIAGILDVVGGQIESQWMRR